MFRVILSKSESNKFENKLRLDYKIEYNKFIEDTIEINKDITVKYGFLEYNKFNGYFHINKKLLN